MDGLDFAYVALVSVAGGLARALRRGLPAGWRLRLEAVAPEGIAPGWVWLHAVSVGELILAEGILRWLRDQGCRVHVTTGTVAGHELLQKRLAGWDQGSGRVSGGAFPLDDPAGLRSFLAAKPGLFVVLETELWPNLLRELACAGVPAAVVNGRLTDRTLRKRGLARRLLARAASRLSLVAARDAGSLEAFRALGAPRVVLGGNLKADLPAPQPLHPGWDALRQAWAAHPVVVAGNTVDGEEALVLEAWARARAEFPEVRLILAPRQPRRFQAVASDFARRGLAFRRASEPWRSEPSDWAATDVLLLDTLGELPAAYREGTVALVGGGWAWHGGHNPLESARWGMPTLLGPGYSNFEDLVLPLKAAGLVSITASEELGDRILQVLRRVASGQVGLRPDSTPAPLPPELSGALARSCKELKPWLSSFR